MGDDFNCVLLAVPWPIVKEVVDVNFEFLQLVLWHVSHVVLQFLQCGQLHIRHHASLLVQSPHDAGHQTTDTLDINRGEDMTMRVKKKFDTHTSRLIARTDCKVKH